MLYIKEIFILISFLFNMYIPSFGAIEIPAITVVPVADLVGDSLKVDSNSTSVCPSYASIPLSGNHAESCLRLHQIVFNEHVTIIEEKGEEVRIKITNLFFEKENNSTKYDTFWSLRSNFMPIDELKKNDVSLNKFPLPLSFFGHNSIKKVVTLLFPWQDKETRLTYSAGTRFVMADHDKKKVSVYIFNPARKKIKTALIPLSFCYMNGIVSDNAEKITAFVHVLKKWAHLGQGFIPYVWGGISFTQSCNDHRFIKKNVSSSNNNQTYVYNWPSCDYVPKTGFDCTGLVARAAQIVDIPYYYKNTTTLAKYLKPIEPNTIPQEGDLIWFPGHVLIIADGKKNSIIEARAYGQGFGKIHELPLCQAFKDINTIEDLAQAFHQKKSLERLDSNQMPVQHIPQFKIFSLKSVWSHNTANSKDR